MNDDKLTVYSVEVGEIRKVVATKNAFRAARLLDLSRHLFSIHGRITHSDTEVQLALSDPGAVWGSQLDGSEWIKVSSSRKAKVFAPQGGRRIGAGRPRTAETLRKQRCISADDSMWATFKERGGTSFLERVLLAGLDLDGSEWSRLADLGGIVWLRQALTSPHKLISQVPDEAIESLSDDLSTQSSDQQGRPWRPRGGFSQRKPRTISTNDEIWGLFLKCGGTPFLRSLLASGVDLSEHEWERYKEAGGIEWLRARLGNGLNNNGAVVKSGASGKNRSQP